TADEIIAFLNEGAEEGRTTLGSTAAGMAQGFDKATQACAEGLTALEQTTAESLDRLDAQLNAKRTTLTEGTRRGLEGSKTGFDDAAQAVEDRVTDELQQSRDDLDADLRAKIAEVRPEVDTAIDEGMEKNQEALNDLPGAMREAASDAAWDYDHEILAAIRDVAALVAGVIVGIVLVIALVVLVIVGFKVLIAGLVAAGISLAVAKAIAVVVGLGMLAYGVYSAYSARVEAGLAAGPWEIVQDLTGISAIRQSFENPNLSPFDRGMAFGEGAATLAAFVVLRGRRARQMDTRINARLPRGVTSPQRGALLPKGVQERFGFGPSAPTVPAAPGAV